MDMLSEKIYLQLTPPSEEDSTADMERLISALEEAGYAPVEQTLRAARQLHPACTGSGWSITATLLRRDSVWTLTAVEPGDARSAHYGLAVDYGSTTIIMQLVDVHSGAEIGCVSAPNGQRAYGTDILSRITFATEAPGNAAMLREATAATFNDLLDRVTEETGISASECAAMVISGNTAMIHFLLELDGWTVFASPYAPVATNPGWLRGSELGIDFPGYIYFIPAASNYVGGDIVSGLLTMDFHKQEALGVFFDIGTNGELVIGNRYWLLAGAGAAGPALEGYISRYGVRAQNGAIDHVGIRGGALSYTTIGGGKPIGICGSGIIDLIAQLRLAGWINIAGELNQEASPRIVYLKDEKQLAVIYALPEESAFGEALFFTQTDIRQYLETKAAAHTMLDCLLETAGLDESDIDRFYLSGAFTAHSDLESAITVGIFPDLPRDKYTVIRNASLDGARALLLDRSCAEDIRRLTRELYCVQFASIPDFLVRMYAAKYVPHTDMEKYPSVIKRLNEARLR